MTAIFISQADKSAIEAIFDAMSTAWKNRDGTAYAEPFSDEADYMVWNGMFSKGKESIAHSHQHIFDTFYKGTMMELEVVGARYLADDVAVVHCHGALRDAQGEVTGTTTREGVKPVFVLVKRDGRWEIEVFQNTPIISPPVG